MNGFVGTAYKCEVCGYKLQSKRSGHFIMCDCGEQSFVDQTEYYTRCGGRAVLDYEPLAKDIKELLEQGASFVELSKEHTCGSNFKVEIWEERQEEGVIISERHYCLFTDDGGIIDFNADLDVLLEENMEGEWVGILEEELDLTM